MRSNILIGAVLSLALSLCACESIALVPGDIGPNQKVFYTNGQALIYEDARTPDGGVVVVEAGGYPQKDKLGLAIFCQNRTKENLDIDPATIEVYGVEADGSVVSVPVVDPDAYIRARHNQLVAEAALDGISNGLNSDQTAAAINENTDAENLREEEKANEDLSSSLLRRNTVVPGQGAGGFVLCDDSQRYQEYHVAVRFGGHLFKFDLRPAEK